MITKTDWYYMHDKVKTAIVDEYLTIKWRLDPLCGKYGPNEILRERKDMLYRIFGRHNLYPYYYHKCLNMLSKGAHVKHKKWGWGRVADLEVKGGEYYYEVIFEKGRGCFHIDNLEPLD